MDPTEQHYDVIGSIRTILTHLRTTFHHQRVKGHQDDNIGVRDYTHCELLNIKCDLLAKHARKHLSPYPEHTPPLDLPFEKMSLWHDNIKIYRNYRKTMSQKCHILKVRQYYCRKYGWTRHNFDDVNWDAVDGAMQLSTPTTTKWISKLSCGFVGLAKTLARREYWLDSMCPRCNHHTEDNIHLITCPHVDIRSKLNSALLELENWMTSTGSSPHLSFEIIRSIKHWVDCQTMNGFDTTIPAIQRQLDIGWSHFMFGRISIAITSHQQNYFTSQSSRRTGQSWTSQLIQKLWTLILRPMWNHRNKYVHGKEPKTTARLHSDIIQEATELYFSTDKDNLQSQDRHLLEPSLSSILSRRHFEIVAWINSIEMSIHSAAHNLEPTNDRTQTFLLPHVPIPPHPAPPARVPLPTIENTPHLSSV